MKHLFKRILFPVLIAISLASSSFVVPAQADPILQSPTGRVMSFTAPVSGVVSAGTRITRGMLWKIGEREE